jgi:integrase
MFRHTHATELIHEGVGMAYVQKRLGHASIQTTIDTYIHVSNEDMKREYNQYLSNRYEAESANNSETE